jgi:hypothetical protein
MTAAEGLVGYGLAPDDDSLPAVRLLLAGEAASEREGRPREEDLALLCGVQLFARGLLGDVLRVWDAKRAGMDLGSYLGVQLLCGAGLSETKQFLAGHPSPQAAEALAYITECEGAGDFEGFTPNEHLEYYRRYFGTAYTSRG